MATFIPTATTGEGFTGLPSTDHFLFVTDPSFITGDSFNGGGSGVEVAFFDVILLQPSGGATAVNWNLNAPTILVNWEVLAGSSVDDTVQITASRLAQFGFMHGNDGNDTLELTGGGIFDLSGKSVAFEVLDF